MRFAVSSNQSELAALLAAVNVVFGFPRTGATSYASFVPNNAAKKTPPAAGAEWAFRVDYAQPYADDPTAAQATWRTAEQAFALPPSDPHYIALPASAVLLVAIRRLRASYMASRLYLS